ncbi:hypothetical protein CAF53_05545 [Sphingobium sp. LB126]|uniref:hypothetical protein n=1 Tax=Sphingobium sp. LB126 TaxID=1983755 RepID=UPI000C209268|nr:hypothetical protein [Sphingobium sp. LB126]PJG47764.1 hypothetical protein CAF53_05545 [Sphingobium sp. LB126]
MPLVNRMAARLNRHPIGELAIRYLPETLFCLAAIAALFLLHDIPITHDVVWQFWVARQISNGSVLYRDIWEINPPLWFWSALPIHHAAAWLHIPPLRLLVAVVIGTGALSALLTGHLAGLSSPFPRLAMMLLILWLVVVMPIYDFGQREQLALIGALPYAALIARRSMGTAIPTALAVLIGTMAAYGFALKHYFALIPIMLEIWLIVRKRSQWRAIRPEVLVLVIGALIYGLAIIAFAPAFFTESVPMVRAAYHGYESSWKMMFLRPWFLVWAFMTAFFLTFGGALGKKANPLVSTLLIVVVGFALAYFLQRKGWLYHSIPVTGAFALALGVRLGMVDLRRPIPLVIGPMMLVLPLLMPFLTGQYFNWFRDEIDPILTTVPKGSAVYIATADPMWGWPTVEDRNLIWPSRLSAFWMIPAIAHGEVIGPNPAPLRLLGKRILIEADQEIRCSSPTLIFFERRKNYIFQPMSFNVRDFFLRNNNIRSYLLNNYDELKPTRWLYIYRRVTPAYRALNDPRCPDFKARIS